jgi:hypothetical protein
MKWENVCASVVNQIDHETITFKRIVFSGFAVCYHFGIKETKPSNLSISFKSALNDAGERNVGM